MFILKMLHLLHARGDVGSGTVLTVFHVYVKVADLRIQLFDLLSRVMVEVMNHVFLFEACYA